VISTLLLRTGVLLALVGAGIGIVMGISHDFALAPAHAHLNLLGFVALFLSGLYYRAVPAAAASVLGALHAWIAIAGAVAFPIGIAAVQKGGAKFEFRAVAGALIVLGGMVLFGIVVFRHSRD